MKVAVIGAGVIGVTTAYELLIDGHEVTVFERTQTAAEGASFANGGLILPGWPAIAGSPAGLDSLKPATWWDSSAWRWVWHRHRDRKSPQAKSVLEARTRLIQHSQARLMVLCASHGLEFDRSEGALLLWRQSREGDRIRAALPELREWGVTAREITPDRARQIEPALSGQTPLLGALELPDAFNANTRQFTLLLKNIAMSKGCRFEFGSRIEHIRLEGGHGVSLTLADNRHESFDRVVVCAGSSSPALVRATGLDLPSQPIHAHSISTAIREPLDAPLSAVIDAGHQVSIARLGQRVRVAGGAMLGGQPQAASTAEVQRLYRVLMDWFPGAARLGDPKSAVQTWFGTQTTMPDGAPVVGQSPAPQVWLNTGHGSQGWAMACGCARTLADMLANRGPDINMQAFSPMRFGK